MKILIYGMTTKFGGVEKYVIDRLPTLTKHNQVDLAFPGNDVIEYQDLIKNIEVKRIYRLSTPFKYFKSLYDLIKQGRYDVVYCNIGFANGLLYFIIKLAGAKLVVHAHSTALDIHNNYIRLIMSIYHFMCKKCCSFLVDEKYGCSMAACKWLFNKYDSYSVKNNAINCKPFLVNEKVRDSKRKEFGLTNEFVIGHVGRFCYQKNNEFIIRIFKELQNKYENSRLVLIGIGEDFEKIKKLVKILDLEEKVMFLGLRYDVPDLMQAMDCFVLPSRFEGLPIVGIEAQVNGLQCYFSDTITKEIAITKNAHFLSLKDSPEIWAEKILEAKGKKKVDMLEEVTKAGYDIEAEIAEINARYEKSKYDFSISTEL